MTDIRFSDAALLEDAARFFDAYAAVPASRREKVDRLRSGAAKRLSLCAGKLLADALRDRGVDASDMLLAEGPYGKPWLPRRPDVQFSLSHSGSRAMCVTADVPVGCDIQQITPCSLRVAERFFTAEERRCIFAPADESEQRALFFRIWTLKESFIKCVGLGLSLPLESFSVFPEGDRIVLRQTYDDGRYAFTEPDAGAGYCSAVCLREA